MTDYCVHRNHSKNQIGTICFLMSVKDENFFLNLTTFSLKWINRLRQEYSKFEDSSVDILWYLSVSASSVSMYSTPADTGK